MPVDHDPFRGFARGETPKPRKKAAKKAVKKATAKKATTRQQTPAAL